MTRCASAVMPAWFLCHRRPYRRRCGGAAAAVVTAPAQRRAIRAAGRRGRRARRVSHGPKTKYRGGGFIVVELFGCRLHKGEENV